VSSGGADSDGGRWFGSGPGNLKEWRGETVNTKTLANLYSQLSAEERFRLVVAAYERGDEAERERLKNASKRITFSKTDYSAYIEALQDLATLVLLMLVEEATAFDDAFERWRDTDTAGIIAGMRKGILARTEKDDQIIMDRLFGDRLFFQWLAQGFDLRTLAAGWKLFCERLGISPFVLWRILPGFDRLQRALDTVEGTQDQPGPALTPKGMACWLNRIRPAGKPEVTEGEMMMMTEGYADAFGASFRERVEKCGG
jgi:hypothetical protein